jgi:hypothetical protein
MRVGNESGRRGVKGTGKERGKKERGEGEVKERGERKQKESERSVKGVKERELGVKSRVKAE